MRELHSSGGTSLRVAMEEAAVPSPGGYTAPMPWICPVSPQSKKAWIRWLRAAARVDTVGGAAAALEELPHALPPAPGGADMAVGYGGLRLCGKPCCGNFPRTAEAELQLKQCAGCMAVRCCGARAHWREGHRRGCKVLLNRQREEVWQNRSRPWCYA